MGKIQRRQTEIGVFKKKVSRGISFRQRGLNGDEDKEVKIPNLCFDAKCYLLHCTLYSTARLRAQLPIQEKA